MVCIQNGVAFGMRDVTVILDDDPTGVQTVRGCPLLTDYARESIEKVIKKGAPFFFILTNLRSIPREAAQLRLEEVLRDVLGGAYPARGRHSRQFHEGAGPGGNV